MTYRIALILLIILAGCKDNPETVDKINQEPVVGLITENAMVVSATEEASNIGAAILKKGGNAYDAMIAIEMALAVTYPYAGNLGGGGFMVYRTHYGEIGSLDYREKAPIAASRDMFLDKTGNYNKELSKIGSLSVGVPGTVAGIFAVHEKLGSLPMEVILQPVIELALNGYKITDKQAERLEKYRAIFKKTNEEESIFTYEYLPGTLFKNEALANTLIAIANNGRQEFYKGATAMKLVSYLNAKESIISLEDLRAYEVEWREPIIFDYKDLKIISMAPPSSGGICLAQMLKMLEPYSLTDYGHNSLKSIQLITEVERRAYADRSYYLGDPDFVEIPTDSLTSEAYLRERMKSFSFEKATPSDEVKPGEIYFNESEETTHYSIIDSQGNAASVTTTLNSGYGSKLYVKELGFFLNNEMDDFSSKPGEPNIYGLIGGEANAIAPQKRMLSSMTPTIIEKNNKLFMVVGTPGGATIITSVLQAILNVEEYGMGMQEAVNAPRFHHQWLPDAIRFELDRFPQELKNQLFELGYPENKDVDPTIGKIDAILVLDDGRLEGGADPRGDDKAVGF